MLYMKEIPVQVNDDPDDIYTTRIKAGITIQSEVVVDRSTRQLRSGSYEQAMSIAAENAQFEVFAYLYGDVRGILRELIYHLQCAQGGNPEVRDVITKIERSLAEMKLL